jgi:hypothetical protein
MFASSQNCCLLFLQPNRWVLTYMSIDRILQPLLVDGRLRELPSLFTGFETARTMIVTPEIFAAVTPPFPKGTDGVRLAEFRNWLDAFSEGGELSVAENPLKKPHDAMLARVEPTNAEFWSIRVTDPDKTPGMRSLGAFVDTDKFVALTWDYRENIDSFDAEVEDVRRIWESLFVSQLPHTGDCLDDYVSNYISV